MQKSVYSECMEAAQRLLTGVESPSDYEAAGIFTELDIIFSAARRAGGWDEMQMRIAQREASQVIGSLFRTRQVARYGPLQIPGLPKPDYMRVASKIVYADPKTGPETIETPNGTFPRLLIDDDPIVHQGRRKGANRDDFKLWSEQDLLGLEETAEVREVRRLQEELRIARQQLRQRVVQ